MSEEKIDYSLYGLPKDTQSIYVRYTEKVLLDGFREEALRHREQITKTLELINQLKDKYKGKRIYCNKKFLNQLENVLGDSSNE